jgi:hypothetical protein
MTSSWTHPLCDLCWLATTGGVRADRIPVSERSSERCCRCGARTNTGIYVRATPGSMLYCPDQIA